MGLQTDMVATTTTLPTGTNMVLATGTGTTTTLTALRESLGTTLLRALMGAVTTRMEVAIPVATRMVPLVATEAITTHRGNLGTTRTVPQVVMEAAIKAATITVPRAAMEAEMTAATRTALRVVMGVATTTRATLTDPLVDSTTTIMTPLLEDTLAELLPISVAPGSTSLDLGIRSKVL